MKCIEKFSGLVLAADANNKNVVLLVCAKSIICAFIVLCQIEKCC